MTKSNEIEALTKFIAGLPVDSYLKPWLQDILPQVESEIMSDFPVSPSLVETRRHCAVMVAEAQAEVKRIVSQAEASAKNIEALARERSGRSENYAIEHLRQALRVFGA